MSWWKPVHVAHSRQAPALDITGVTVSYAGQNALDAVTLQLERGVRAALVGPNGAGKSTLIKVLAGLLPPTTGTVKIFGEKPGQHICIAYIPQRPEIDWSFPVSVRDVTLMGRTGRKGLLRRANRQDRQVVEEALETVGLREVAGRQIRELSGGQQQRMFMARALAQEVELMLWDEPMSGVDAASQAGILALLDQASAKGVTILVATHDLGQAATRFDQVVLLNRQLVAYGPPRQVLTPAQLTRLYGSHLHVAQTDATTLLVQDSCCGGGQQ